MIIIVIIIIIIIIIILIIIIIIIITTTTTTINNNYYNYYYNCLLKASESEPDDQSLDVFGMPGFSPLSTIHTSVSVGSLAGLDETDRSANSSPALPRKSLPSTSIGARDGLIRFNMEQRENEYTHTEYMK